MLYPAGKELGRRDSRLKGLSVLLEPDELVARLRNCLPFDEVHGAQVTYVRYKPGISCLVAYRLETNGGTLDIYGKAVAAIDKMRKAYRKGGTSSLHGPGAVILENDAIALFVFPQDGKLNLLPELFTEDGRSRFLQKTLPREPQLWEAGLERIRYKPEQRFVGRLSVDGAPLAKIKVYAPARFRESSANAKAILSGGPLKVPRRIGRSTRHHTVIFEWAEGNLLKDVILGTLFEPRAVETAGAALAEIHSQKADGLKYLTRNSECSSLLAAAAELQFIFPHLEKRVRELARELARILFGAPPVDYPVHGDFNSEQILINDGSAIILDLDNAVRTDPSADLGLFIAHLEEDNLTGVLSQCRLEMARNAFLRGYESAAGSPPANIELYTSVGLLRVAADLHRTLARFGRHAADWPRLTESLLERAWSYLQETGGIFHRGTGPRKKIEVIDPFNLLQQPDMPFLAGALNPAQAQKRLGECLLQARCASNRHSDIRAIRVTRHKPGRRCIVEYDIELEDPSSSVPEAVTLLGKVRAKKGLDERTYSCVKSLWRHGFGTDSPDGIMVAEPVGVIPEFRMWLQKKVRGTGAIRSLAGPDGAALARRIVDATYKLQQANVTPCRKPHVMTDELGILHQRLPEVSRLRPEWSKRIERVLKECDRLGDAAPRCRTVCCHRDFYYEHVIVDDNRLYLLDFDLYCKGDQGLDTGNFIAHLKEYALRVLGNSGALADIEKAMGQRYVKLYNEEAYVLMHTYILLTLARHIYLSTQSSERRMFTEDLLELCEESFAAGAVPGLSR